MGLSGAGGIYLGYVELVMFKVIWGGGGTWRYQWNMFRVPLTWQRSRSFWGSFDALATFRK